MPKTQSVADWPRERFVQSGWTSVGFDRYTLQPVGHPYRFDAPPYLGDAFANRRTFLVITERLVVFEDGAYLWFYVTDG